MEKIKLRVLGLSMSENAGNAYALILADDISGKRIPIIIGAFEAQSIAIELEGLKPPRPLTHDLFKNVAAVMEYDLLEVNIYKLEEGIFHANLLLDSGKKQVVIDSRTSDAVALALRFKCPIFTTDDIIQKAGIFLKIEENAKTEEDNDEDFDDIEDKLDLSIDKDRSFASMTIAELEEKLSDAINNEEYERAAAIKKEISQRK